MLLLHVVVVAALVKATQQILVDRDITGLNDEAVKSITDRARDNRWPHIFIFPEGTCGIQDVGVCRRVDIFCDLKFNRCVYKQKGSSNIQER